MLGPIFLREVLTVPRSAGHFVLRAAYLGGLLVVAVTAWLATLGLSRTATLGDSARLGPLLFVLLTYVQLALFLFFPALACASAIAKEKEIEAQKRDIQEVIRERVSVERTVVEEQQRIKDTEEFAAAERQKKVAVTKAEQDAAQQLVLRVKEAEASKQAAELHAEQLVVEPRGALRGRVGHESRLGRVPWITGDGIRDPDGSRQGGGRLSYRAYSSRPTT